MAYVSEVARLAKTGKATEQQDADEFARFRDAGRELRMTHLMKDAEPTLSETRARFPVAGDNTVEKVEWDDGCPNWLILSSIRASRCPFPAGATWKCDGYRLDFLPKSKGNSPVPPHEGGRSIALATSESGCGEMRNGKVP